MQQQGQHLIPAPPEVVWQALNDPDELAACITGCEEITQTDENRFDARVKAKVGPVSAVFTAELNLTDLNPPTSYTIVGDVKGGAAGFGKGAARVALTAEGDGTILTYDVDAKVGGKLAQVGSRLIDAAARKMADEFFTAFSTRLGATPAAHEQDHQPAVGATNSTWWVWLIAAAAAIIATAVAISR